MFILFTICCLLAALPVCAEVIQDDDRLQFAHGLYARGLDDVAIREYETYLQKYPDSPEADVIHYRLGECYRRQNNNVAAEKEFRHVFASFPDSEFRLRAGFRRASIFMDVGQLESAIDLFKDLVAEDLPADLAAASTYYLGDALWRFGQTNEAAEALQKVIQNYPDTEFQAFALLKLGRFYGESSNSVAEAVEVYTQASQNPSSARTGAEAWFQLGELYFAQKDFKKSAEAYQHLLEEYPSDQRTAEARLQAGWAFHNSGLHADALRNCAETLPGVTGPVKEEWLYLKANCERQLMQNEAAVKTYAELLATGEKSPFRAAARYEKALTHFRMGQFADAVMEAKKVDGKSDLAKDVLWLLAESYAAMDAEADAIQYYRLLIRDFPDSDVSADAHYRLGFHLQSLGEYKEASRYFSVIPNAFPDSDLAPRALFASASCLANAGMDAEAARDWSTLIREYADSNFVEESLFQKGMCEARLDRDNEAVLSLQEMLRKFPESRYAADAHFWLGILFKAADRIQDAEREFREVIRLAPRDDLTREAQFHLATVLQKLEQLDESSTLFAGLLDYNDSSAKLSAALLEWLAEYTCSKGKYDESIKAADLLRSQPDARWQQIGYGLLGRAWSASGDDGKAADAFKKSLDCDAQTALAAESALRLGEIAFKTNDFATADGYFRQAAELAGGDEMRSIRAHAYAGMGRTAEATGDMDAAARYFLSVAILYDDPALAPECLFKAAKCFDTLQRAADRDNTLNELRQRYPDSQWTESISTEL